MRGQPALPAPLTSCPALLIRLHDTILRCRINAAFRSQVERRIYAERSCQKKFLLRLVDYPDLDGYLRDLYQQPGIAETVNFDPSNGTITNPTRIVPLGPILDLQRPHGRERLR